MKLSIDLDKEYTPDGNDTIGDLLRQTIQDEVTAFVRAEVRRQMKSKEKEVKDMVAQVANKDWRQLATMLLAMKEKPHG